METENLYQLELRRHLKKILLKTAALRMAAGLIGLLAVGAWGFLLLVLWAALTSAPPMWQVQLASRVTAVAGIVLFGFFMVRPLLRLPSLSRLAAEVEQRRDFQDIVRAGYEFSNDSRAMGRYAPDLVREVIRRAVRSISGLEVRFLFLSRRTLALVPVAYGALLVILVLLAINPAVLLDAGERVLAPHQSAALDHEANLFVVPGDITVLSGSDVEVSAVDLGRADKPVQVKYNLMNGFWKTEPVAKVPAEDGSEFKQHSYTFNNLRSTVSYYFVSGDRQSPTHTIRVVHKPIVRNLKLTLSPPPYTGEPREVVENSGGNIKALEGTRIHVEGETNNILRGARVRFDEGKSKDTAFDGNTFAFEFTALKDGSYTILLEDTLGHKTDDPLIHTVEVFDDHPPALDVLEPADHPELPRNYLVGLSFIASDDYGVRGAAVYSRKGGEGTFVRTGIPLEDQTDMKEVARSFVWNLEGVDFFPGEYLEFYIEVEDNNVITGPGKTKSRLFHLSAPTMAELYNKARDEETERSNLFDEALREGNALKERLEKLEREFLKTEQLEWSQKKEIDKAVASQKGIEEKIDAIRQSLDESLQSMSDNKMTSQQIGEKLEQIQQLLEDINSESLDEYIEKLQQAMEKLTPEEIREALKELNVSSEELLKQLERTAELLEEIRKEQMMEELVRESENLMDDQRDLNESTSEADSGDESKMKDLADQQLELADKTDQLKDSIEQLAGELPEDQETSSQLSEASKELSQKQTSQKMKKASQQLQQCKPQEAQDEQEQALDDLVDLFTKIATAQMEMQQGSGQRLAINLQRLARQTLRLSFKQETLADRLHARVSTDDPGEVRLLAEEQQSYYKALLRLTDDLEKIASKSVLISPGLLRLLGESLTRMQNSVLLLEQNKAFMSYASASQAVGSLNEATIQLLETTKNMGSGSSCSSTGLQSMMEQLLSGEQNIQQRTKELLPMQALAEQMLQERQAQLKRLAGEQRSLREIAQQIQNSLENNEELLGRLDKTLETMDEVIRDFEQGSVSDRTLQLEERIISRLLDAQRSVNTRDYEKTRRSETAEDIFSKKLNQGSSEQSAKTLREAIQKAMKLKAPGEFEDLIRLYFRALAEESNPAAGGGGE